MANINDYLLWRGDLPINRAYPFNEIDSMILSRFSYLRFDKIKLLSEESIASVSQKMSNMSNEDFLYNGDKELITNLGSSERFNHMVITDYIKMDDKNTEKQFGAVTIHISDREMYISYLGTDSTIVGWKEDFNMAFMDNVPCQVSGKEYLERLAQKYPNKKIRIGGHSKGGNVAIYSAITVSKEIQDRILQVNNYDGPGFSKDIIAKYERGKIFEKIRTFIPQESIIGRILYHKERVTISNSIEKAIYQHDIYSWQVLKDKMILSERNTEVSEDMQHAMIDWLENTTTKQRKIFFDSVFELFYSTEARTFSEMRKTPTKSISKILEKYKELLPEDRKIVTDIMKSLVSSYWKTIKEKETSKFQLSKENWNQMIESAKKEIGKKEDK